MNDDTTITRSIVALRERIEETEATIKHLEGLRARRQALLAIEKEYPNRWRPKHRRDK